MPMTVGIKSREDMKMIFGLCDKDGDGLIRWQDFRGIGQEHFDQEQVGCHSFVCCKCVCSTRSSFFPCCCVNP